jgi:hypothetical protein
MKCVLVEILEAVGSLIGPYRRGITIPETIAQNGNHKYPRDIQANAQEKDLSGGHLLHSGPQ